MLSNITFANLVLNAFYLRILFITIGLFISVKIIGIDKIFSLKKYVKRNFFPLEKIIYLGVAFFSLVFFKNLLSDDSLSSLSQVFNNNFLISLLLTLLLLLILYDSFIFMIGSSISAKKISQEINKANFFNKISDIVSGVSLVIPVSFFLRFLFFGASIAFSNYIDNTVRNTLSNKIKETISNTIKIVLLNIFIILGTLYVSVP